MVERGGDEADWPWSAPITNRASGSPTRSRPIEPRRPGTSARHLAEARAHLSKALDQLAGFLPVPRRDRIECGLRLERGHLTGMVDGYQGHCRRRFRTLRAVARSAPQTIELLGA
jgi:hypothetical protein